MYAWVRGVAHKYSDALTVFSNRWYIRAASTSETKDKRFGLQISLTRTYPRLKPTEIGRMSSPTRQSENGLCDALPVLMGLACTASDDVQAVGVLFFAANLPHPLMLACLLMIRRYGAPPRALAGGSKIAPGGSNGEALGCSLFDPPCCGALPISTPASAAAGALVFFSLCCQNVKGGATHEMVCFVCGLWLTRPEMP